MFPPALWPRGTHGRQFFFAEPACYRHGVPRGPAVRRDPFVKFRHRPYLAGKINDGWIFVIERYAGGKSVLPAHVHARVEQGFLEPRCPCPAKIHIVMIVAIRELIVHYDGSSECVNRHVPHGSIGFCKGRIVQRIDEVIPDGQMCRVGDTASHPPGKTHRLCISYNMKDNWLGGCRAR